MEAVGAQLTTIFNERKADMLAAMLDMNALGARVAANVFENERGRSEFVRGFKKSAQPRHWSMTSSGSSTAPPTAPPSS